MHRRLSVVLGVWIVFQTLTGLVLVFRDPIEHHAHPGLTRHGHGDLGAAAALDAVRRRYPGEPVGPLATPAVSDGVYVIEAGEREVYVDPATARINGARDDEAGFTALVERLHRRFLFDELPGVPGARLVALLGAGWLVVAGSGVAVRARGRRTDGRGAGVRHRRLGVVVAVPMALVVVTGVRLAVPAGADRIWAAVTGSGQGRPDLPPRGVTVTSADGGAAPLDATQALAAVRRKYPDGLVARLLMPRPGDRTAPVIAGVSVGLDPGRGQHDDGGNTVVFLDQSSGATLWEGRPDRVPAARQAALLWSRPLHTGAVAGPVGELLWGWLALAVVALAVSGLGARRARTREERLEQDEARRLQRRRRRQLRRRKTLARRRRRRTARAARDRRRAARRLQRRRKFQARIAPIVPGPEPAGPDPAGPEFAASEPPDPQPPDPEPPDPEPPDPEPPEPQPPEPLARPAFGGRGALVWCSTPSKSLPEPAADIDLTEPAMEIDLTDAPVEIDLTEPPAVYESTVVLETGETVESGIVGPADPV